MATVTTNATNGKKKLVYKQDPDGVFRLKKLTEDDKLSTKSDKRTVDDYLNDLISCAYQVVDPKTNTTTKDVESIASPQSDAFDNNADNEEVADREISTNINLTGGPLTAGSDKFTSDKFTGVSGSKGPSKVTKPKLKSSQTAPVGQGFRKDSSLPGLNINFDLGSTKSLEDPNQNQSPLSYFPPHTPSRVESVDMPNNSNNNNNQTIIEEPKRLQRAFNSINTSVSIFHIPSFTIGVTIAIILNQLSSHILYYSKIAFDYAKVGVIWAIVLGAISWYAGIIKIQDVSSLKTFTEDLLTRLTGRIKHGHQAESQQSPNHNGYMEVPLAPDPNDGIHGFDNIHSKPQDISIHDYIDDDTPSPPPAHHLAHRQYDNNRRHSERSRSMAKVKTRQKSLSPSRSPKQSRKNTLTNVMPFKAPVRNSPINSSFKTHDDFKSPSVPNLPSHETQNHSQVPPTLNRLHSAEPKSNYSKFVERSKHNKHKSSASGDSFDSANLRYPPPIPNHITNNVNNNGPLPQLPDEDLPFINEVKLVNSEETFHDNYPEELHEFVGGKENVPYDHNDHDTLTELPSNFGINPVKRLNSTMSKKSVLGTRANYNKFLENAQYVDHD